MPHPLVIIGAGGFGRHVLSILRTPELQAKYDFLGFLDDGEVDRARLSKLGAPLLGTSQCLAHLEPDTRYVIGIGSSRVRRLLDDRARSAGLLPATIIHPDTSIAEDVEIGEGSVICAGVRITTNAVLGRQVHLNMNVTVGHDAVVEDYATVFPQVALGGETVIGAGSTVGATACINPSLQVGADSYVASGAAVTHDVPAGMLVAGVPATVKKQTAGGNRERIPVSAHAVSGTWTD